MTTAPALRQRIQELREDVSAEGDALLARWKPWILRRDFSYSARNLAHYLALRKRDLRSLQEALMPWGLSSLGRCESRVLPTLDGVLASLDSLCREKTPGVEHPDERAYFRGLRFLARRASRALGPEPPGRHVRVMVTLPPEAASDYAFVRDLLSGGATCFRINCAHEGAAEWEAMAAHVRRAERDCGLPARILMDLAGPKMRIGAVSEMLRIEKGLQFVLTHEAPSAGAQPVEVSCAEPGIVEALEVGERVMIDDGSVVGTILGRVPKGVLVEVVRCKGKKLKPEKGLNFPDSDLTVQPLTEKDRDDLDTAVRLADLIGYSYVQTAGTSAFFRTSYAAAFPEPGGKWESSRRSRRRAPCGICPRSSCAPPAPSPSAS